MDTNSALEIIRPVDLATQLSVSKNTLVRWEEKGLLPKRRRLGERAAGYLRAEIEEWLKNCPEAIGDDNHGANSRR